MKPLGVGGATSMARAVELLLAGGTVAFPTETVYGLGANALDAAAVAKIFEAKERPGWDPLIVHVDGRGDAASGWRSIPAELREPAQALMEAFWPGPLTLLLPRTAEVPDAVTAGAYAGGCADAGASGGAGVDPAGRRAGGGAEREPVRRYRVRRRPRMCWRIWTGGLMRCWMADRRGWGWSRRCWMLGRGRSTGRAR